jgi:hypothetical protein
LVERKERNVLLSGEIKKPEGKNNDARKYKKEKRRFSKKT